MATEAVGRMPHYLRDKRLGLFYDETDRIRSLNEDEPNTFRAAFTQLMAIGTSLADRLCDGAG